MMNHKKPVSISELAEAFQLQSEDLFHYVNKITGEVARIGQEELGYVEDGDIDEEGFLDDFPQWQQELILYAKEVYESHDFVPILSRYEINTYEIMEEFCCSVEDANVQDNLLHAIRGNGAFGRFKTAILCYNIEDEWYQFLNEKMKAKAIVWCESEGILYV